MDDNKYETTSNDNDDEGDEERDFWQKNDRVKLGENLERPDWQSVADAYEDILDDICDELNIDQCDAYKQCSLCKFPVLSRKAKEWVRCNTCKDALVCPECNCSTSYCSKRCWENRLATNIL